MTTPDTDRRWRGLPFSPEMVLADLRGDKTETRRLILPEAYGAAPFEVERYERYPDGTYRAVCWPTDGDESFSIRSPYGGPEDGVYVKEAFKLPATLDGCTPNQAVADSTEAGYEGEVPTQYLADGAHVGHDYELARCGVTPEGEGWGRYRHARFMPRALARTRRLVREARIERLHEITEASAQAEGVLYTSVLSGHGPMYVEAFEDLWDEINGHREGARWADNPPVWVYRYRALPGGAS